MKEELVYKWLMKNTNGILFSLVDLNQCGKKLFYIFIHLFLKEEDISIKTIIIYLCKCMNMGIDKRIKLLRRQNHILIHAYVRMGLSVAPTVISS